MEIIFDPSLIALKQNISRAEEAIELAGSLLARRQICSAEYVNEMLTVYEDFGAAIVIDDGIAMPHARPKKGHYRPGSHLSPPPGQSPSATMSSIRFPWSSRSPAPMLTVISK